MPQEIEDDAPFIAESALDPAEESARKVQEFFGAKTIKDVQITREAVVNPPGPEDLDDPALVDKLDADLGKLAVTEVDEASLRMLRMVRARIKELEAVESGLTTKLKSLIGKDRGLIQRGGEAILVEESAPASRVDTKATEAWIRDQMKDEGVAEWRATCFRGGNGEPSVRIKVIRKGDGA